MWQDNWRLSIWSQLDQPWDIVVIGGGITGAGILREATRLGLRVLLVEQRDFAWGTSSRSSKLVHGGLRYLREGRIGLIRSSVKEREQLLEDGPGLIDPLGFLLATYNDARAGRILFEAGLTVYDLLALRWSHEHYSSRDFRMLVPHLSTEGLTGGFRYGDAQTDDARLVLRVIQEAVADGGVAINYVSADRLKRRDDGQVVGLHLLDHVSERTRTVDARLVINATGAWADRLRGQIGVRSRIRPLRGSHLIFPSWRLPLAQAISFLHPIDQRPVFIFPWEGITLVGTTDVDHRDPLDDEPRISPEETAYLMAAVESQFPTLAITLDDVISTFSGVRPVIGSGKRDPSQESRDHAVWEESGLLTVTGGKLTTFRVIALDVLKAVRHRLPQLVEPNRDTPVLNPVDARLLDSVQLDEATRRRLIGRYGSDARALIEAAEPDELARIPGSSWQWAELRWAARSEGVVHLDDLLLRRLRLGLVLPEGGASLLPRIRAICQPELGWDDERWQTEREAYLDLWRRCYSLPEASSVPDWRELLKDAKRLRAWRRSQRRRRTRQRLALLGLLASLILLLAYRRILSKRST